MNEDAQIPLFSAAPDDPVVRSPRTRTAGTRTAGARQAGYPAAAGGAAGNTLLINPHLLAARRLSRRMRQFPEHSEAETLAGLAICRQLKAFLQDEISTTSH